MKKLLNKALAIDFEFDQVGQKNRIIEIGMTVVDLDTLELGPTYDLFPELDQDIDPEIEKLCGLRTNKVRKSMISWRECLRRMHNYGIRNRLIITDDDGEMNLLHGFYDHYEDDGINKPVWVECSNLNINISVLYRIITGENKSVSLADILKEFGLEFEGRQHRANDDSRNIARVYCEMVKRIRDGQRAKAEALH